MGNILDQGYRSNILEEINGEENLKRKEESLRRYDVYRGQQRQYILRSLAQEMSAKTVSQMRTISSINLTKRIIDEQSSIYKVSPLRKFFDKSGSLLSDQQTKQAESIYKIGNFDIQFKKSNKAYKLNSDEIHLQVVPKYGKICLRVLFPHHLDVIPDENDPSKANIYIVSTYDRSRIESPVLSDAKGYNNNLGTVTNGYSDTINQTIADQDDWKVNYRAVWWSNEYNFMTNGYGQIIDQSSGVPFGETIEEDEIKNQINKAPFVRVGQSNDFEYWTRAASGTVDFNIDFGVLLSDTANINRLQGFAQAIVYSDKIPNDFVIGPNRVLHLPLSNDKDIQPRFEFVTPSPNMDASLELLESYMRLFLTSQGMDPKIMSGKLDGQKYSSGLERLLAMVERFEASRDDLDAFSSAEAQVYELARDWSNLFQSATSSTEYSEPLVQDLRGGSLPEDSYVVPEFYKPEVIQTKSEEEDSIIKKMESGLMSRVEAIGALRSVPPETAAQILANIDSELVTPIFKG